MSWMGRIDAAFGTVFVTEMDALFLCTEALSQRTFHSPPTDSPSM